MVDDGRVEDASRERDEAPGLPRHLAIVDATKPDYCDSVIHEERVTVKM